MHITHFVRNMVEEATTHNEAVLGKFNGVELLANPGQEPETLVQEYDRVKSRSRQQYLASDQRKKELEEQRNREQARASQKANALRDAPSMTLTDAALWAKFAENNTDPYGSGIVRYAENWARATERAVSLGEALEDCADRLSHEVDDEGITGFMYGCAVRILSQVWIHGEALRQWHNLKMQIGSEGEKANADGKVLNPALLTVK